MESGKVLRIEFTFFAVWIAPMCPNDYVNVTDGDGTTLMGKGCGYLNRSPTSSGYFKPPIITTMTNTVDIFFHTDGSGTQTGWSLNWAAVTPGLKPLLNISRHIKSSLTTKHVYAIHISKTNSFCLQLPRQIINICC